MRLFFLVALLCASASVTVLAATDDDGYNEYTIRVRDIPADAPKFEEFPAELYLGKNAPLVMDSDETTKMFHSTLAEWANEKPNFAGHYIVATWGCGTNCTSIAVIDAKTGKIHYPEGVTANHAVNVEDSLLYGTKMCEKDTLYCAGSIKFRPGSRLLVLIGAPEENSQERGISYYVWENNKMRRIRFVHKGWYPEKKI
jgi:hypothetical protein